MVSHTTIATLLIVLVFGILCSGCGETGSGVDSKRMSDTCFLNVPDNRSYFEVLFAEVKTNNYCNCYVIRHKREDEFGYYNWVERSCIKNFSEEDYEELKLYANVDKYLEKVVQNKRENMKWSVESLPR